MKFIRSSIRHQLTLLLLISIIVPTGTSLIITYFYTKQTLQQQTTKEMSRLISEVKTNLTNYLVTINSASMTIYFNDKLNAMLMQQPSDYETEASIFESLQITSRAAKDISQVNFYVSKSKKLYSIQNNNIQSVQLYAPPSFPSGIAPYSAITTPPGFSGSIGIQQEKPVFTLYRPVYRVPSSEQIGMLSIQVSVESLRKLTSQLIGTDQEDLYILDSAGKVIYATNETIIGQELSEAWVHPMLESPVKFGNIQWDSPEFSGIMIYNQIDLPFLQWTMVQRIPNKYLFEKARHLTWINVAVASLFLIVSIIATLIVCLKITVPIKLLMKKINKIQLGHWDEEISIDRPDEIGILAQRFQSMMQKINELIIREYKLELANKSTQLKMLQAQINPHFINNSLQSIGNLALDYHADKVYALISSLGQMMHYSMDTKETIVPLSKEIDYVNYYLTLQQKRFEDKFTIQTDIDEDTLSILVPKMFLQPLVENYFKHGLGSSREFGILSLVTRLQNGQLIIIVEDNGTGLQEKVLFRLQQDLDAPLHGAWEIGDRIGLMNVLFRLRLYFDAEAEMLLTNCKPHGLRITITIPLKENQP